MPSSGEPPPGMFKVAFDLDRISSTWPPFAIERIWAKKAPGDFQLELANSPFFVRGISCGDVILAKPDRERRELVFNGLVRHSGNSTVRVILIDDAPALKERVLEVVRQAGCSWEFSSAPSHFAVDVPVAVDYRSLRGELVRFVEPNSIEVEEAFISSDHEHQLDA